MVKNSHGRLSGSGGLDDESLTKLEDSLAKAGNASERQLFHAMTNVIDRELMQPSPIADRLGWVPHLDEYLDGLFYSLYSGDSSHLRASLIAPLVSTFLHWVNDHPDIQLLGAQGTDTADATVLPLLDAFLFDTELKPVLLTGANRSQYEWNSDAPKNFSDLIQLAGAHLPSGAYWVFGSHLYRASDMLKIDPTESRRIENFTTFLAPRLTSQFTKKVIGENPLHHPTKGQKVKQDHPISTLTGEKLFDALNAIETVDLGNLNAVYDDVERITSNKKAVIVSGFALGNGSNPIKKAIIQASQKGKIVIITDRTLLGVVSGRYEAGLIWAGNGQVRAISGHKMGQSAARAVLVRAIVQQLDSAKTQELINKYCESRQLLS